MYIHFHIPSLYYSEIYLGLSRMWTMYLMKHYDSVLALQADRQSIHADAQLALGQCGGTYGLSPLMRVDPSPAV